MTKTIVIVMTVAASVMAQTADDFFAPGPVEEMHLRLHPADWQKLKDTYLENTYYNATMKWRGVVTEDIAIRSRGRGSRAGEKPSLRLDFDRNEPGQRFLGMKSVNLKNNSQDASLMKEYISMGLFRRMGMPAPRETFVKLMVNNQYAGLYLVVESVDKQFLTRHFGDDDGFLYQYVPPMKYDFEYMGADTKSYVPVPFEPKTNESKPEPEVIVDMIRAINQAPDEEFAEAMSKYLDLKAYVVHVAVELYVADFDGMLAMNNYFLYRAEKSTRFRTIPWDKDFSFTWHEFTVFKNLHQNVLMRRVFAVPELRQAFVDTLASAAEAAGGEGGWLETEAAAVYERIRDAALADTKKQCGPKLHTCSNDEFETEAARVKIFGRDRLKWVAAEIAANGYAPLPRAFSVFAGEAGGGVLTLAGEGIPLNGVEVFVGGLRAEVLSLAADRVEVKVPPVLPAGAAPVTVSVAGVPAAVVMTVITK